VINPAAIQAEELPESFSVEPAIPCEMSDRIVLFWPFTFQHGFSAAIIQLLVPIGANGRTAMMPDHCAWMKAECPATLLQAPAEIHVVASDAKRWVETAHCFQSGATKSHVAAGQMFSNAVGNEHVRWIARRMVHALRNECVVLK